MRFARDVMDDRARPTRSPRACRFDDLDRRTLDETAIDVDVDRIGSERIALIEAEREDPPALHSLDRRADSAVI
jgi:hypothetical protein